MRLITHYPSNAEKCQPKVENWRENYVNEALFYSYRTNRYNLKTYPSALHYHDYFELVIIEEGDISYVCEGDTVRPNSGDIILIPPRKMHMSKINADATLYKRHVFYFYPDALDFAGCGVLMDFARQDEGGYMLFTLNALEKQKLLSLLFRLDAALEKGADEKEKALRTGLVIGIFYILNHAGRADLEAHEKLPRAVTEIREYIDENFAEIDSVSEIAAHFYYSREYVSRIFRKYFNTTVSDYINQRRIAHSQFLIEKGMPLSDVCYRVGYGSMSAFIRSFKEIAHMTPSKYRTRTIREE